MKKREVNEFDNDNTQNFPTQKGFQNKKTQPFGQKKEKPHERMIKRLITQPREKESVKRLEKLEYVRKNINNPEVFEEILHPPEETQPLKQKSKLNMIKKSHILEENEDDLKAKLKKKHFQLSQNANLNMNEPKKSKTVQVLNDKWRMCTEKEGNLRESSRQLDIFERDPAFLVDGEWLDQLPRAKPEWCIKKYSRSDAGKDYEEPFPLDVLQNTLNYILDNIIDVDNQKTVKYARKVGSASHDFFDIYDFVYDRFRSINQDLTILQLETKKETIQVFFMFHKWWKKKYFLKF